MSVVSRNCKILYQTNCWHQKANFIKNSNFKLINIYTNSSKYSTYTRLPRLFYNHALPSSKLPFCTHVAKMTTISQDAKKIQEQAHKDEEERRKQNEQSWRMMKFSLAFIGASMGIAAGFLIYDITKPMYDEHGNVIEDEFSHLPLIQQIYKRVLREMNYYKKLVQEPSREKLLPDPLKYPYIQPPYTIVLEMTDVLVHPDWTYQTGWRFKKRPGVDHFLETVAPPNFETVVYTAEQGMTMFPILDALDPQGCIMFRLFRDSTRFLDNRHLKDVEAINRDLSKVIVIDWNKDSVYLHPENLLKIPRWTGNDDDTALYDLANFLKTIYASNVEDVREVLSYYRQFENPLEAFRENQRKLLSQIEEEEALMKKDDKSPSKWTPSFFRRH